MGRMSDRATVQRKGTDLVVRVAITLRPVWHVIDIYADVYVPTVRVVRRFCVYFCKVLPEYYGYLVTIYSSSSFARVISKDSDGANSQQVLKRLPNEALPNL